VVAPAAPPVAVAESVRPVAVVEDGFGRVAAAGAADPAETSDGSWVTG
jgi:hypothetical protein